MSAADGASREAGAWFVEADHVSVTALARRRSRARIDEERAKRVAKRMRTGQVDINGGQFNMLAPFGGYKQSGNGRELGRYGLEEFLEVKAIQFKVAK